MKRFILLGFIITVGLTYVNAETWQEYRNRVEVMSERVVDHGFFEGDYWKDKLAAVWATHDWCYSQYSYILENDNTMTPNIRAGRALSMFLHEKEGDKFADIARKLSSDSYRWVCQRYDYWYNHLKKGGWINFKTF